MIYVLHHIISIHKKTPEPASSGSAAPIHSIQFFVFSASGIVIHLKCIKTHQFIMVRFWMALGRKMSHIFSSRPGFGPGFGVKAYRFQDVLKQ